MTTYLENYACSEEIFSMEEMEALKEREKCVNNRNGANYYRCKKLHSQLYHDLTAAFTPFITTDMLAMLNHSYDTQKNEAMNNSVASYAPKSKTYSLTDSLKCRIAIAAGIQICGYAALWTKIFRSLGLNMDDNMRASLDDRDKKKMKKRMVCETKGGKVKRGRARSDKFTAAKKEYFEGLRIGMAYESGIALQSVKKQLKSLPSGGRNKGVAAANRRCKYYHPNYCTALGHADARSKECYANLLSTTERDSVLKRYSMKL